MRTILAATMSLALVLAPQHARAEDSRAQDATVMRTAAHLLATMEGDAHRVATLLRTARASHAPGPAKCVDGFLSQIDANVRHGREDLAEIRAAIVSNDRAAALRAMGWLASRREAARNASFAADSCLVPALAQERDQTVVRVIVNPALPSDRAVFGSR